MQLKKIVIIGPESTGKSSLCEKLALHYHTAWVHEYARTYLLEHGMNYNEEDLIKIAIGQLALEDKVAALLQNQSPVPRVMFIDTDMYVMKVWSEFVFKKTHPWIISQIASRKYDLYLLCNTDLPWIKDELREYPDLQTREKLHETYRELLNSQSTPWVDIRGNYDERLLIAVSAVDSLLDATASNNNSLR